MLVPLLDSLYTGANSIQVTDFGNLTYASSSLNFWVSVAELSIYTKAHYNIHTYNTMLRGSYALSGMSVSTDSKCLVSVKQTPETSRVKRRMLPAGSMEPPPPRQRRQWAVGNERITLAELAAAGVKTPERDHWPHSHPFDHPPSRTTHSAGSSKAEALFQDRRTSAESHLDSRRTSEKRVSDGGVRAREQGFNLQLSGANEERVKAQLKRQVQGGGRRSSGNGGGTEEEHRRRRNWQRAQQLVIRTDDGAALPVEESTGGRKSRGEGEVEGATGAVKAGGKGDGADSEKDGSRSMRVKVLEEACGHMESDERRKGGSGERDATEEGREFEQRENGDEGKRRGARHVAEDQGRDDEADFTVVQEMVEPDAMEPPFETDLSVAESPHSEKHVVNVDGKGTRAETGATVRASVSYESEDFEAYEESFEEDLSLGDEGAQTERADAETPLRVASKSNPPNRETLAQLPLESPPSVSVPPLETVDSPDMIRSFDAKSARFGDAGPSFRPAEGNGTGGTGTVAGSVTYSSVQDWGMARSETFGSMEVVDVSEEADVGEPDVSVTANLRPSVVKREELEVEEIEEEDLSEEGISEVGSPGSAQLEQESGAVSEESDSNSEEPVPTVTRSERFVEPNLSPAVESPRATFAGSPLGKPGRVRPLSALSSRIPAEPVPRAPLTARNGSKPGTDVSLVLEAVRRENAKALAAQKERLTEGRTEERKSGTEAERRKSGTEAERWKIGTEGERRTSGTDELEAGFLMKEGPARRPSKDWEQETVAQRQDGLFTNGLRVAQMQSFKEKPTKPLLPELNERLRLLDTQKQEYLLEVIQKLERCQAPKELQNPQVPKELRNPQGAIGETGSTVLGHGKVGDVSEVAGRRAAELAPQVDGKDGEPYRQPSMAIKQTGKRVDHL